MVVDSILMDKLKLFGLNSYQAKLWTALLSRGIATAGELSDISNVPRSRAYDVLESLEKKGFITMKVGKPIKYMAVPPKDVAARVTQRIHEEAQQQAQMIDELKDTKLMGELQTLHDEGVKRIDPTEMTSSVRGRANIYNHLSSMLDRSNATVQLCTSSQGLLRKVDAFKRQFEELAAKGISVRILAPKDKVTDALAKELHGLAEVKPTELNSRFMLVDGKELMFMLADDTQLHASYDTAIAVKSPFFVSSMADLFGREWEK